MKQMFQDRVDAADAKYPGYAGAWQELYDILLSLGGNDVVHHLDADPHLIPLLKEGSIEDGTVTLVEGPPSSCHSNSAWLWVGGFADCIVTGYALDTDGLWRQHSWCIANDEESILETVSIREQYFGIRLYDEDAEIFADDQL